MEMENGRSRSLLALLDSHKEQLAAVNVARLFGWGNSRVLRLMSALQKAGLIDPIANRPGEFTVNMAALVNGLPQNIVDQVCDVLSNERIGAGHE